MTIGDRVSWRSLNRDYTGTVVGFHRCWAVVELPNGKRSLVYDKERDKK